MAKGSFGVKVIVFYTINSIHEFEVLSSKTQKSLINKTLCPKNHKHPIYVPFISPSHLFPKNSCLLNSSPLIIPFKNHTIHSSTETYYIYRHIPNLNCK